MGNMGQETMGQGVSPRSRAVAAPMSRRASGICGVSSRLWDGAERGREGNVVLGCLDEGDGVQLGEEDLHQGLAAQGGHREAALARGKPQSS